MQISCLYWSRINTEVKQKERIIQLPMYHFGTLLLYVNAECKIQK